MLSISSERLQLIPLTYKHLQLWSEDRTLLDQALDLAPAALQYDNDVLAEIDDALQNYWLPNTTQHPDQYYWFTNWDIVLVSENRVIGGIGLMGLPNENGETMVGYGLSKLYHKQGFASEALQCLLAWAFQHPDLKAIIATTLPENIASYKVLQKNGFLSKGQLDEYMHWRLERS